MQGFVKMSKYAGMREDLVQAGGGNSSFKFDDEQMVIKASGYQLADITEDDGFAVVNYKMICDSFLNCDHLDSMKNDESNRILAEAFIEGKKPSIETFLHAISGKYTLHTHPIVINALTCREAGMEQLSEIFPEALLVPYATPGVELAKAFFCAYKKKTNSTNKVFDVVFLQNHGLVVSAESAEEVISKTEAITRRIEKELYCEYDGYHNLTKLWNYFQNKIIWMVTDSNFLEAVGKLNGNWQHTFCPDCVVFLGKKMLYLPNEFSEKDISDFVTENGQPIMINWKSKYYLVADSVKKAMEIQSIMSFSAQVMLLNKDVRCNLLSDQEQNFLLNWDAEKYRKNMK